MTESTFPKPVADVVATLIDIFRHQNKPEIVELIENAHAYFDETDYDNWNGGTYTWALRLEVPVHVFASAEPRLPEIEKDVETKLEYLARLYPNDHVREVTVTPLTSDEATLGQRMAPSEIDVRRLWDDGHVRLFLSHVSKHKSEVSALKNALKDRGISAFVAHEDIEPSLEWQNEISLALRSMHALAALITPDFHNSSWTDQEVGWALGRGVLVLPIRLGTDPYGFTGKVQAIPGDLKQPVQIANEITRALLRKSQTHGQMRRSLVLAFTASDCFATAAMLKDIIVNIEGITEEERGMLRKACIENSQVSGSRGVTDAIYQTFGRPQEGTNNSADGDASAGLRKTI